MEWFITKRLPEIVDESLSQYVAAEKATLEKELAELRQRIEESGKALGQVPFDEHGHLKAAFREGELGKRYLEIIRQLQDLEVAEEVKSRIYNDLYTFFSRYYEDGDFVSKRLRGRGESYAIPYNGEEVVLYWANKDQYYVKGAEHFRTYRFKVGEYAVVFELRNASTDQNDNKGTKRYFVLLGEDAVTWDEKARTLTLMFEYRELTGDEQGKYGNTERQRPQDKINEEALRRVLNEVPEHRLQVYLAKEEADGQPLLLKHLRRFTRKNTTDFFIHKNLKSFLLRELDFFIKNEVLLLDELIGDRARNLDRNLRRAQVVRDIGQRIIDFLAQVEDFQKKLWEKKKFVIRTEYCATIDRVPEEMWDEVLSNRQQIEEWRELYQLKELKRSWPNKEFLKSHPTLVVDTRHFPEDFKWRLLASIDDLDEALDGLLIKSENWQALNLLLEKYRGRVQTVYIDPPFNKEEEADYPYRVNYKDSTWLAMLQDRIWLAKQLLNDKGSIFVRCDNNGNMYVRLLMDEIFGKQSFRNEIILNRYQKKSTNGFTTTTESLFLYSSGSINKLPKPRQCIYCKQPVDPKWTWAHSAGESKHPRYFAVDGKRVLLYPPKGRHWTNSQEEIDRLQAEGRIRINHKASYIDVRGQRINFVPEKLQAEEVEVDNNWTDIPGYAFHVFTAEKFSTQNSEEVLKRVIQSTSREGDWVMDFFLGSGTTTAVAHKLKRKWIGVEMGEYFWTTVLPRMKRVLFYDESGISKDSDVQEKYNRRTCGGMFCYHVLEQYEDTLNNLELPRARDGQLALDMFGDEYLLKYMLDFETQGSASLISLERFKDPFDYRLRVQEGDEIVERKVDLIDTFNYMLGITVRKIRSFETDEGHYRAVLGERNGKRVVVIWRSVRNMEEDKAKLMADKMFIENTILPALIADGAWPDRIFVNSPCYVEGAEAIEPEFARLMFAGVA